MCSLHAYNKENYKSTDATDFGGGRPLPEYSKTDSLVSLCVSIKFIDTCLNVLDFFLRGVVAPIKKLMPTIYILPVFIKAVVFHHVGLSYMIETKDKYKSSVEEYFIE